MSNLANKLITFLIGVGIITPIIVGSIYQWNVAESNFSRFTLTVYGLTTAFHLLIQIFAAYANHRKFTKLKTAYLSNHIEKTRTIHRDVTNNVYNHNIKNNNLSDTIGLDIISNAYSDSEIELPHNYKSISINSAAHSKSNSANSLSKSNISIRINDNKSYAIQIVGFREDPHYFELCLKRAKSIYLTDELCSRIIIVVDGNLDDDMYMKNISDRLFGNMRYKSILYKSNIIDDSDTLKNSKAEKLYDFDIICILQEHKGKRHAMYTSMWLSIKWNIPYVLMTDSDTILDMEAPKYLLQAMLDDSVYATTGLVKIFNQQNWLSVLIDLKYWFAFNLERAAQSYFGCVCCISGPLGLYRTDKLVLIINEWVNQTFLCKPTTFGDDRHLTNLLLKLGGKIYYTPYAICETETPLVLSRWLTQQTRWGRSFIREYLINIKWFHKVSIWLVYDLTYLTFYSAFLFVFAILMILNLHIDSLMLIIATSIISTAIRAVYAVYIEKDFKFMCFSLYGIMYFLTLLPLKAWSTFSMRVNSWGTSSRRIITNTFIDCIPVVLWNLFLIYGIVNSILTFEKVGKYIFSITTIISMGFNVLSIASIIIYYMAIRSRLFMAQELMEKNI